MSSQELDVVEQMMMVIVELLLLMLLWTSSTYSTTPTNTNTPEHLRIANFQSWLLRNGADVDAIKISHSTSNGIRGVFAVKNIPSGRNFFTIPTRLLLTCSQASHRGYEFLTTLRNDFHCLLFLLMAETLQGKGSFWYPYLALLDTPPPVLELWPTQDLMELQDPYLTQEVHTRQRAMKEEYKLAMRVVQPLFDEVHPGMSTSFSFELFKWASFQISSRAFQLQSNEIALVPLADLLNHGATASDVRLSESNSRVHMFSDTITYTAGQELIGFYGWQSSRLLLLEYGFAIENNPFDVVLLLTIPFDEPASHDGVVQDPQQDIVLPSRVRVNDLLELLQSFKSHDGEDIQTQHVVRFAKLLRECERRLEFELLFSPTTELQDRQLLLLLASHSSLNFRHALYYRMGRKSLMHRYLTMCQSIRQGVVCWSPYGYDKNIRTWLGFFLKVKRMVCQHSGPGCVLRR